MAHVMLKDTLECVKDNEMNFEVTVIKYKVHFEQLDCSIIRRHIECLRTKLEKIYKDYTGLFGGVADIDPANLEWRDPYQYPNTH